MELERVFRERPPYKCTDLEGQRGAELLAVEQPGQLGVMALERPGPEDVVEEPREGIEGWEALLDEGRPPKVEVRLRRGKVGFVAWEAPRLEAVDGVYMWWGVVGCGYV